MARTCIRDLAWIVAWNGERHVYQRGGDVVFEGDRLVHVGGRFEGTAAREIDGSALMAMPGFVNVHGHLGTEPLGKRFYEELGSHKLNMSRIYEFIYTIRPDKDAVAPATRYSVAELMKSGCTTVADMGIPYADWIDVYAGTGVRAFLSRCFVPRRGTRRAITRSSTSGMKPRASAASLPDLKCAMRPRAIPPGALAAS